MAEEIEDDIKQLVRELGIVDDEGDEIKTMELHIDIDQFGNFQRTSISNEDYKPSAINAGMPAMFLAPKTISAEREELYEKELFIEKTANIGQFKFVKTIYSNITDKTRKAMNKLLRATTGENFVTAQKSNITYIVFDKKDRVIGYAMISTYSPENHFKTEGPYLYNFITDISLKKEARCGHALLDYIERDVAESGAKLINLDVDHENVRAFKFFIFNKYRVIGKYEKLDLKNMNLFEIDRTVAKYKLTDKIKEIKQRRGLAAEESEPVTIGDSIDEPNKKIRYISMTKTL